MSKDLIKYDGGDNVYSYVMQNPVRWVDPSGLDETNLYNNSNGRKPLRDGPTNGNWGRGQYSCASNDQACIRACDRKLEEDLRALDSDPRKWPHPPRKEFADATKGFSDLAVEWFK